MADDPFAQAGYGVRLEWGPAGAARLTHPDGALVIVDVLSFTTSVAVAVERGAAVYPAPWGGGRAGDLARRHDAVLAVGRRHVDTAHPWSLSPASLHRDGLPPRLVVPSPNGSAIASSAGDGHVLAACLRNASAVAAWLLRAGFGSPGRPISVVPAGERWPDGTLRPAIEDLLGAGAVVAAVKRAASLEVSPEAVAAAASYGGMRSVAEAVRDGASGRELRAAGFGADVEIAVTEAETSVVPVLRDGAFVADFA